MVSGGPAPSQPQTGPPGQPAATVGVQRAVGDQDDDARPAVAAIGTVAWCCGRLVVGAEPAAERPAGHGQPVPPAEVGQHHRPQQMTVRQQPGRRADPALEAEALHPGTGADAALGRRRPGADPVPGRLPGPLDVPVGQPHPARVGQPGVVALGHHRDHHVVHPDPRVPTGQQRAGRVVHPADLHRRGQEHRRLQPAPLADRDESGALPHPVQHRATGRHRRAERVTLQVQHRDAGAHHAAALRRGRLVQHQGGVAQAHPGHVVDRAGGPARQQAERAGRQVAGAWHGHQPGRSVPARGSTGTLRMPTSDEC